MAVEDHNGEVVSPQEECTDCDISASESSFDGLARGLADGTISRRKALRMLGATLVGGVLASIPGTAWAARPSCPSGMRSCRGTCVDTNTDPQNCGRCNRACSPDPPTQGSGLSCAGGECMCPPDAVLCPGSRIGRNAACCKPCGTVNPVYYPYDYTCCCETDAFGNETCIACQEPRPEAPLGTVCLPPLEPGQPRCYFACNTDADCPDSSFNVCCNGVCSAAGSC
jgi:hypothetical protein